MSFSRSLIVVALLVAHCGGRTATPTNVCATSSPQYTDLSKGLPRTGFGVAVVDAAHNNLLLAAEDNGLPSVLICRLDGTNCTYTDLPPSWGGGLPLIDAPNAKLLVVAAHSVPSMVQPLSALIRCDLDATNCTFTDISVSGLGQFATSAVIDAANAKLLVVTVNNGLLRCNLDGTGCTFTDISAGRGSNAMNFPTALIDAANGKLLVVTEDDDNMQKAALFRCNLDGTDCTYTDISAGRPQGSGETPSAVIDSVNDKLLVVTDDAANTYKPALFRCNLDGSGCTYADISAGQDGSSSNLSAVIDSPNATLLVATQGPASFAATSMAVAAPTQTSPEDMLGWLETPSLTASMATFWSRRSPGGTNTRRLAHRVA